VCEVGGLKALFSPCNTYLFLTFFPQFFWKKYNPLKIQYLRGISAAEKLQKPPTPPLLEEKSLRMATA
jgi:hypothetical protein